jgi:hypothetical protein
MKPIDAFSEAHSRALYLVDLYNLLHNTRQRRIRSDWADSFKSLMHWNRSDELERVDGNGCVLILRNPTQWTMQHFEHEHLSELLRSALICGVSALDRYLHDVICKHVLPLLSRPQDQVPKKLARFEICLSDAEAAVAHALRSRRANGTATRPRTTLKAKFADALHKRSFQSSSEIEQAFRLLDIRSPWGKVAQRMAGDADVVRRRLDQIVHRRNQIVHEGDMMRSPKPRDVKLHDITSGKTRADLEWLRSLVQAMDRVIAQTL